MNRLDITRTDIGRWLTLVLVVWLSGCAASQPASLQGEVDTEATPAAVSTDWQSLEGLRVRWGGLITQVNVKANATWLEIVALPLDSKGKPMDVDRSLGRFLVKVDGFLEPEIYGKGRKITVLGEIQGVQRGTVGELPYVYPVVAADGYHLWPKSKKRQRVPVIVVPAGYWDPFWPHYRVYPGHYYLGKPEPKRSKVHQEQQDK